MLKFTEEEKNEIITYVIEDLINGVFVCLWDYGCKNVCDRIFPRSAKEETCPCNVYAKKYVKDKFWKAME